MYTDKYCRTHEISVVSRIRTDIVRHLDSRRKNVLDVLNLDY